MLTKVAQDDFLTVMSVRAQNRARIGARLLDRALPDWESKFEDPVEKPINMSSTHQCVLAQLYGRYRDGLAHLMFGDVQAHLLGFRGCRHELRNSMPNFAHYYKALSAAWEHERKSRLD